MSFPLGKCSSSRSKGPAGFTASGLCQWTDRKGLPSQKKNSKILGGGGWVGLETFVAGGENLGGGPLGVGKTPEQRRELVTLPGTVLGGWKASHTHPPPQVRMGPLSGQGPQGAACSPRGVRNHFAGTGTSTELGRGC